MNLNKDHLSALAAILKHGSFEGAATALSVTPSAISQRVKGLEEQVGAALIKRGQPCTATSIGARFARHAEDVGLLEAKLMQDLALDAPANRTPVRLAVNADSLDTWFARALTRVPDLLFEIVVDDQDHSADWLRRGDVCAAVTAGDAPAPGCDIQPLGALRYIATASPAFMQQWFKDGVNAATLSRAPCLVFGPKDRLQHNWMAHVTGTDPTPPVHYFPSTHAYADAAAGGLGWGMNPEPLVRDALAQEDLIAVLPDRPLDVPMFWQISRLLAPALKPLTQAVVQTAKEILR